MERVKRKYLNERHISAKRLSSVAVMIGGLSIFGSMPKLSETNSSSITSNEIGIIYQNLAKDITVASLKKEDNPSDNVRINGPNVITLDGVLDNEKSVEIKSPGGNTLYLFDVVSPINDTNINGLPTTSSVSVEVLKYPPKEVYSNTPLEEVYSYTLLKDAPAGWVATKIGYNLTDQQSAARNYYFDSLNNNATSTALGFKRFVAVSSQATDIIADSRAGDSLTPGPNGYLLK